MADSIAETINSASDRDLSKVDEEVNSSPPVHRQQTTDEAQIEDKRERVESPEDWIQGIKLFMVVAGVTLATLLFMLDVSIVSTVNEAYEG